LLGVGIVGMLALTVMIMGAVFFHLRMQGAFGYLRMGKPGIEFFVRMFPWKLVGLSLVGFIGGFMMLKKHDQVYKVGIGWLVLGAVVTVLGLGFLVDRVGVNDRLREHKPLKRMYEMRFEDREKTIEEMMGQGSRTFRNSRVK